MNFDYIIFKNFKYNLRKYVTFFLCNSFSIIIFYLFQTLINDDYFQRVYKSDKTVESMLFACLMVVAVFSIAFISYAHCVFIKSRSKEFGIYVTLGLTRKDIRRMVLDENIIISVSSLLTGLIVGSILSRFFKILMKEISGIEAIQFSFSVSNYICTAIFYLFAFLTILAISLHYLSKLEISQMLKEDRRVEEKTMGRPVFGLIGIALVLTCIVILIKFRNSEFVGFIILLSVGMCMLGAYLTISYFGNLIFSLTKKREEYFYKNILNISEINVKFNQNKKVYLAVSILVAAIIFASGFTYSLNKTFNYYVEYWNPFDITFPQISDINQINDSELADIINNSQIPVKDTYKLEFILLTNSKSPDELENHEDRVMLLKEEQYNLCFNENLKLGKGAAALIPLAAENKYKNKISLDEFHLSNKYKIDCILSDRFHNKNSDIIGCANYIVIITNDDYSEIGKSVDTSKQGYLNLIKFNDWRNTGSLSTKIKDILNEHNSKLDKRVVNMFPFNSIYDTYNIMKLENGFIFFICSFIGILFFLASSGIIYFNIYSYLDYTIVKYKKIFRIGISNKEIRYQIKKELKAVIFIPFILGTVIGYIYLFTLFSIGHFNQMYKYSLVIFPIYLVIQILYYMLVYKIYCNKIIRAMADDLNLI